MKTLQRYSIFALALVAAALFPLFGSEYGIHLGVGIAINAIAVLGLGVLGSSGQVSLAQAAFYGIGAYTSSLLAVHFGIPFWIGIVAAAAVAAVAGLLVGLPTIRVSGLYLVMVTLGVNEIVWLVMMNAIPLTGGPSGVLNIPAPRFFGISLLATSHYYYLALAFLVLFAWLTLRVIRSRLGAYFKALESSQLASSMVGINVVRTKLIAFVISAVWGGVAGALYAHYIGYISPDSFRLDLSVMLLIMAVFGGQTSVGGMLLATAVLSAATEYLRVIGNFRMIAYGALLVLGMVYMPRGIGPFLARIRLRRRRTDVGANGAKGASPR